MHTLRETGYNATNSISEEISGLFLYTLPAVWPVSKAWRLSFVYLFDGLKLALASMFFIVIPAGLVYAVCNFIITSLTGWQAESNLVPFLVGIFLCVLFMPFYFGAVIQSAEKRQLSELFNIRRASAAGRQCYRRSLIALLSAIIVFSLYTGLLLLLSWWFSWGFLLFVFTIPAFAAALTTSIHLITQAFDAYPHGDLRAKQVPIGSDQTPHWIWLGYSNLVTLLWFFVIALLMPLMYKESGWLGELPTFLTHCDLPLPVILLALLVGSCMCLVAFGVIFHRSNYQKDYDKMANSTHALELDPRDIKAYINRAGAYEALDQRQKAINDYTRAICLDPKAESAYKHRAKLYFEARHYERAIEDYSIAISINPKYESWGTYDYRASAYDLVGQYQQAIDDYNTIINHNPTNSWAVSPVILLTLNFRNWIKIIAKQFLEIKIRASIVGIDTIIKVISAIVVLVLCARGALAQEEEASTSCTLSAPGMKPVTSLSGLPAKSVWELEKDWF